MAKTAVQKLFSFGTQIATNFFLEKKIMILLIYTRADARRPIAMVNTYALVLMECVRWTSPDDSFKIRHNCKNKTLGTLNCKFNTEDEEKEKI